MNPVAQRGECSSAAEFDQGEWFWLKLQRFSLIAILCGLGVLAVAMAGSVRHAVEIGTDEHYELTKALLWANGHPLYKEVWSDQPPLLTALLGTLFRCFSPTIGVARSLSACFGVLLLLGCLLGVRTRCGLLAGCVAAVCLVAAPYVLELSVSAMQEVPMMATTLWALWQVQRWEEDQRWSRLAASGALLAAAMQVKLLAAMTGPALVIEIILASHVNSGAAWLRTALRSLAIWGLSLSAAFVALGLALGWNHDLIWASHFSPQLLAQSSEASRLGFAPRFLYEHRGGLWGAGAGLLVMILRRDWRPLAFPMVLLLTEAVVHFHHRPWWNFYHLHFAVPLAWLTGYGVAGILRKSIISPGTGPRHWLARLGSLAANSALVSLLITDGGMRLVSNVAQIRQLPRVGDSPLLAKVMQYADRTRWIYTRSTIYAFHAQLSLPPELAVISRKRIWSGRITDEQILAIVKQYQPEQVLLASEVLPTAMRTFIDAGYTLVYEDGVHRLYVMKAVVATDRSRGLGRSADEGLRAPN